VVNRFFITVYGSPRSDEAHQESVRRRGKKCIKRSGKNLKHVKVAIRGTVFYS